MAAPTFVSTVLCILVLWSVDLDGVMSTGVAAVKPTQRIPRVPGEFSALG